MRTVTLYDGTPLPVMGLGTWTMGGRNRPDPTQDQRALQALAAAFAIGYTHIDTAEMYANGHAEELVGQALRGMDRPRFFLTTKVRPPNLGYHRTLQSIDGSLRRLGVEQIDLFLIHWRDRTPLAETFRALNEAVRAGKVRTLGVSNFDLAELQEAQALSETPIVTNQVPYSVATRSYVRNGVLPYCQQHGIVVTAYSPVEEGRLRVKTALAEIATQHGATPYQIALAWLVNQPWVITIPMSHNPEHLRQNWDAAEIELTPEQMARLDGLAQTGAVQARVSLRLEQPPSSMEIPTAIAAASPTADDVQDALRPIASLISKSEKAQQKLTPGTWQYAMLRDNLKALCIASVLLNKDAGNSDRFTRDDLQDALRAFASMISKVERAQARFLPGTSQHTLQRNRLKALRTAEALIRVEVTAEQPDSPFDCV